MPSPTPIDQRKLDSIQDYLWRGSGPRFLGAEYHRVSIANGCGNEVIGQQSAMYGVLPDAYQKFLGLGQLYEQALKAQGEQREAAIHELQTELERVLDLGQALGRLEPILHGIHSIVAQLLENKSAL